MISSRTLIFPTYPGRLRPDATSCVCTAVSPTAPTRIQTVSREVPALREYRADHGQAERKRRRGHHHQGQWHLRLSRIGERSGFSRLVRRNWSLVCTEWCNLIRGILLTTPRIFAQRQQPFYLFFARTPRPNLTPGVFPPWTLNDPLS